MQGCIPHGARLGVRLHAATPDTWKSVKRKSALLAELLVQLVFIRKTRTSCRCHDVLFPSSDGRRSPECAVRRCGRENLGTQSPPTSEPPDGSAAGRRTHTYTLTHTLADAFTSARGSDDGDFPCWSGRGGRTL